MDFFVLFIIGLVMGLLGGMLGIGGSVFLIPALTFVGGENQHLYQAAAMICNFFVSASALIAHRKAKVLVKEILKWLIPSAVIGILGGVYLSNSSLFAGANSYLLARAFGLFLVYVVVYNCYRLYLNLHHTKATKEATTFQDTSPFWAGLCGIITGLGAGLLGIGAGSVATPLQQFVLKTPLKKAMGNSALTIVCIAWLGAIYKNWTLPQHGLHFTDSFRIAIFIIPGAVLGGYSGGHLMHALPKNLVRIIFIAVCVLAAVKLLTVAPGA
ncbi:MAG: sulfite exporter TauE/SafE family protein [Planctomycetes bacterium]|nr:sulfite exporter TauE/SafE family protein [Planctomycetota bacterium]